MNQQEKSRQSREKIVNAGIQEFGTKGYAGASLNTLLAANGLSKGLVYHYFKNKDQLYLGCVAVCFERLMAAFAQMEQRDKAADILHHYFEVRSRFFREHPLLEGVFFDAVLQPPSHLAKALAQIRTDLCKRFGKMGRRLQNRIKEYTLQQGVFPEKAAPYFKIVVQYVRGLVPLFHLRKRGHQPFKAHRHAAQVQLVFVFKIVIHQPF